MADLFAMIDERWNVLRAELAGPFTTQKFRTLVEQNAPKAWAEMVRRYGPGGKGSGNFYSPANILYNYLKDKARKNIVLRHGFVPAAEGWGTKIVMQWELVDERALPPAQEDIEFVEGKQTLRTHLVRERAAGIRDRLLKERTNAGLVCDLCGTNGQGLDKNIRSAIFEAHHNTAPLSAGEKKTTIKFSFAMRLLSPRNSPLGGAA